MNQGRYKRDKQQAFSECSKSNIPLEKAEEAVNRVIEMIFKEENILSQWLWRL